MRGYAFHGASRAEHAYLDGADWVRSQRGSDLRADEFGRHQMHATNFGMRLRRYSGDDRNSVHAMIAKCP
jgi:hypothetical protein